MESPNQYKTQKKAVRKYLAYTGGLAILAGLYFSSLYSYLLFHSLAEMFSIVVAFSLFTLAWNSRKYMENHYLAFLGIAYFFVAGLDLLHTLSYQGMQIFTGSDDYATQLWIAARYMECLSILTAFVFLNPTRRFRPFIIFNVYLVLTAGIVLSIMVWSIFPQCFVQGVGLTPFKKASEYVISFILVINIAILVRNRGRFEEPVFNLLIWSLSLTIISELAFTFYVSTYGLSNLVGHFAKLFSYWLIYKAIIQTGLNRPFDLIFRELAAKEKSLARAKGEAEEANRSKSVFLANMSHEIRTPMNVVVNMADFALELADEPRQKDFLRDLKNSARHLLALTDDILDFSKIEAGRLELETVDFDLPEILQSCLKPMEHQARRKGLDFGLTIDDRVPRYVRGDPGRLRQVAINLTQNAIKFTEKGRVRVDVRPAPGNVLEEGDPGPDRAGGAALVMAVEDSGVGIPPDLQEGIFDSYRQADSSITRRFGGTGLGLSICQRLTELMGGRLWVESREGEGSTFYARMNFTRGDETEVQAEKRRSKTHDVPSPAGPLHILVAEDNEMNRKVVDHLLRRQGHTPQFANSGRDALEVLKNNRVDLILMDLEMPEMDGMEATRRIRDGRAGEANRPIPIVAMTAHAIAGFREQCLQVGMDDYVSKPIDPRELAAAIARQLPSPVQAVQGVPTDGRFETDNVTDEPLDRSAALVRTGGDEKLLATILNLFYAETPKNIETLEVLLAAEDWDGLGRQAHSLISSCGLVSARACEKLARRLEHAAMGGRNQGAEALTDELIRELERARGFLEVAGVGVK